MMKASKRMLWLISILSFIGLCFTYSYLPDQIPTHWNVNWEIDDWSNKNSIFLTGILPIAMLILLEFFPKIDPKRENYKKHGKSYTIMQYITVLFLVALNWVTVAACLWKNVNVNKIMPALMGIILIVIGNYMPTIKSNYFVGIKNPWTLSNDFVWRKTHKAGGYIFTLSGILMVLMSFIHNSVFTSFTYFTFIISLIWVNVYSYLLFRKQKNENDET